MSPHPRRAQVNPAESQLLITDPPLNSARNREKLLEILFEDLQFANVLIQPQAVLALYSQGVQKHLPLVSSSPAGDASDRRSGGCRVEDGPRGGLWRGGDAHSAGV